MPTLEARIIELCRSFVDGAVTAQAFVDAFFPLWLAYRDSPLATSGRAGWIDRAMTAADCYGHPAPDLCLSEEALRSEIAGHLTAGA